MIRCRFCGQELAEGSRYCTRCGQAVSADSQPARIKTSHVSGDNRDAEEMNMMALYVMMAALILAVLFPPWEAPPGRAPEFLGFHFILDPPEFGMDGSRGAGVISRLLITVELVTIAVAGMYFSWLLRKKPAASSE